MQRISAWVVLGLVASLSPVASADVISDEEAQCRSSKEGDACAIGDKAGACAKSTCARNDYSEGAPPKLKQVECMICEVGKAPAAPAAEEPVANEDTKSGESASTDKEAVASKDAKSSGCAVGGTPSLGLCMLLLGLVFRRRSSALSQLA